jgi:Fe-Mn family superoxide dismutase
MKRRDFIRWSLGTGALVMLDMAGLGCSRDQTPQAPNIKFPQLPYKNDALEPYISKETILVHYDKHHRGYVDRANRLIEGTRFAQQPVEAIIREAYKADQCAQEALFNNTAQAYNHAFYWNSMKPGGGGPPSEFMHQWIEKSFGSYETFRKAFAETANGHFASGWIWLVLSEGQLEIMATTGAQNPIAIGKIPLLTLDVWEHAYYVDYRNKRAEYVEAFLAHLLNWEFAAANLGEA